MYKDRDKQNAYQRQHQRGQRLKRKKKAIEILGGKCKKCGYNENIHALQVDHIKPQKGRRHDWNGSRCIALLARGLIGTEGLQLLCANCHAIKTCTEDKKHFKGYVA